LIKTTTFSVRNTVEDVNIIPIMMKVCPVYVVVCSLGLTRSSSACKKPIFIEVMGLRNGKVYIV